MKKIEEKKIVGGDSSNEDQVELLLDMIKNQTCISKYDCGRDRECILALTCRADVSIEFIVKGAKKILRGLL